MLSFLPKYIFPKVTDVSPAFLEGKGIRLVLLDFDNTMLSYQTSTPDEALLLWLRRMQAQGIALCIVSNSKKPRVSDFSKRFGVPCVTRAKKPFPRGIYQALERFREEKGHTALIGDQIFTDTLGANCAGVTAILVKSIHNHNFWLKLRHVFEVPFLALAHNRRVKL